jgi:hypothetical protein
MSCKAESWKAKSGKRRTRQLFVSTFSLSAFRFFETRVGFSMPDALI